MGDNNLPFYNFDSINNWTFVYFIQEENRGYIKIGSAENVEKRLKGLQVGNPDKLKILHKTSGGQNLELFLHKKFKEYHIRGEWFRDSEEIINYIDYLKFEDEFYGRVLSIVEFAISNGFDLISSERHLLTDLSRGACLGETSKNIKTKIKMWKILDAYALYKKNFLLV
jgi:T5orf172 domain